MRTNMRWIAAAGAALAVAAAMTTGASAGAPKLYRDDPVWVDRDTQDASGLKKLDVDLWLT
jgi:hypothetical protein